MNLKVFFDSARDSVFAGRMSPAQVEGCVNIIEYRDEHWPKMVNAELAYLLATAEWESGHSMHPVEEGYPLTGNALRAYQRRLRYYPWFGRGLVQITWERNYKKFGIENAEDALKWDAALRCLFEGCVNGMFTGKKLSDYITVGRQDYVGARRIVNGQDKAAHIAKNAKAFLVALVKASAGASSVEKPEIATAPAPEPHPGFMDRISEAFGKLSELPTPVPASIQSAPVLAPTAELFAVAERIEQRQLVMLEKLNAMAAEIEQLKALQSAPQP